MIGCHVPILDRSVHRRQNIGSKGTAMSTTRFEQTSWLLMVGCAVAFSACAFTELAQAQPGYVPAPPPPPPPVFNPSTPYTLPNVREAPVAPGLSSKLPNSSFCSVFHRGPCFPHYLPPIGQDLRLTIVSTDDNGSANTPDGGTNKKWRRRS